MFRTLCNTDMFRNILYSIIFLSTLSISKALNDVIWNEKNQSFVSLYSISSFRILRERYLKKIHDLENHDFHGKPLTLVYTDETRILDFVDNDTRVSGVCGDIWNALADLLNFTLVPLKVNKRTISRKSADNGSILGFIQRNEAQIVPRLAILLTHLDLLEFTVPMWNVRYHIYLKPEFKFDETWMFHLFSTDIFCSYVILLLAISTAGYICQKFSVIKSNGEIHFNLQDHILYTFGIAFSQGHIPHGFENKSRTIYYITCLLSYFVLTAFNSHAIFLMMNKRTALPFSDLQNLFERSDYSIIAFEGSMVHDVFEIKISQFIRNGEDRRRVVYVPSVFEIYRRVCFTNTEKLAAFEAEDRHKAVSENFCKLVPTRAAYFETWVASAFKRGFKYKRSFDIGILKLLETGIINGLRRRWLDLQDKLYQDMPFQSVDMSQVYMIFIVLLVGFTISIALLMIENWIFINSPAKNKSIRNETKIVLTLKKHLSSSTHHRNVYF